MGFNCRACVPVYEKVLMDCEGCHTLYEADSNFCPKCGQPLKEVEVRFFANFGKKGLTSYSCKLPNGVTINSKGNITAKLGKGLSYTVKNR